MNSLRELTELLRTGGPYVLVVLLGFALYTRDRQLRALYDRVIALAEQDATASAGAQAALARLSDVIGELRDAVWRRR